jgi:hypothetical protein
MALLNYTTSINPARTVKEIQEKLVAAHAQSILCDYDGAGNIVAMSFKINTKFGLMAFHLPADPRPVFALLKQQSEQGKIPRRLVGDMDQARCVTWRIIKDWIEAQLAMVETSMVTVEQVFLPYVQNSKGVTLYESLVECKFDGLLLNANNQDNH